MNDIEFETCEVLNLKVFLIALLIIVLGFIITTSLLSYQKYYYNKGIIYRQDNEFYIKMFVDIDDVKDVIENNTISIDGEEYKYHVYYVKKDLYVNDSYKNYQEILLKSTLKNPIENRVVNVSIRTKREKIIKFIINCIRGGKK